MTEKPRIFGADYSVYVRIVRMCVAEKGVAYELRPVDIFGKDRSSGDYHGRHPFVRIPAFEHAGISLYETGAITRYVDERFAEPPLQPRGILERARCNQLISIADNYVYPSLVWGVYVERVSKPREGIAPDEKKIAAALAQARTCLDAMQVVMGGGPWLAGADLTLADIYAAPMLDYFVQAPEGRELLSGFQSIERWWSRINQRPSFTTTAPVQI